MSSGAGEQAGDNVLPPNASPAVGLGSSDVGTDVAVLSQPSGSVLVKVRLCSQRQVMNTSWRHIRTAQPDGKLAYGRESTGALVALLPARCELGLHSLHSARGTRTDVSQCGLRFMRMVGKPGDRPTAVDEQLDSFKDLLRRNDVLMEVLTRAASLELPYWYLTAGCLFQTVWNVVTGKPPADGIKDYDVFYFDAADLSWEAEDLVIQSAKKAFAEIPAEVEIRNEARVHLWYEEKFGTPCTPISSTEDAIDRFAATTCCLGVRLEQDGRWRIYAPHGLSDVFNLVVRPNPVLAPDSVYETKTSRWSRQWPELTVLSWPVPEKRRL